jgi:flagellar assembly protein FliH
MWRETFLFGVLPRLLRSASSWISLVHGLRSRSSALLLLGDDWRGSGYARFAEGRMMRYRAASASSPLLRWQIPELKSAAEPVAMPLATADGIESDVCPAGEQNSPGLDETPISVSVSAQIEKGYNEGWQRGFADGQERGYADGVETGARAAEEALAEQARRLAAIVARLEAPIAELERPVEEAVAALALEVARCVIGNETSRSREYLVRLIREAVAKVPIEMGSLKVILNAADLEVIRALAPELESGKASLTVDDAIAPGDCLVVTDSQGAPIKDMRWRPRSGEGMSQVDLSLAARWRDVMLALFEEEDK